MAGSATSIIYAHRPQTYVEAPFSDACARAGVCMCACVRMVSPQCGFGFLDPRPQTTRMCAGEPWLLTLSRLVRPYTGPVPTVTALTLDSGIRARSWVGVVFVVVALLGGLCQLRIQQLQLQQLQPLELQPQLQQLQHQEL